MRVGHIMKGTPRWVSPETSVEIAACWMRDAGIGFLPVCSVSGHVLGAITDRDLACRVVAAGLPSTVPVRAAMTEGVVAVHADDSVRRAESRMMEQQVSRLVVVDDDGRLVGVLSLSDLAAHERAGRAGRLLKEVVRREHRPPPP